METLFVALRVAVVLGVIVGLLWFVQRRVAKGRGRTKRGNAVAVVGRQGVGPKASVVVVDVDGTRFVLGVTERQVNVLHSGESPQEADAEVTPIRSLRRTFAKDLPAQAAGTQAAGSQTIVSTDTRQDADFLTAQGRASLFDEALKGSILSPATWRQASSAVRPKK